MLLGVPPQISPAYYQSDSARAGIPSPCAGRGVEERLFGSFSGHLSSKEVRPFHRRHGAKMTDIFLVTLVLPQRFLIRQFARQPKWCGQALEHKNAALWAVPQRHHCEEFMKTMAHFVANRCHTPSGPAEAG